MKANEAPEKIWMTDEWVRQFDDKDFMGEDSVEYIRKDAFIDKAVEFLSKEENFPLWEGYNGDYGCDTVLLIKNFINYMKGK